jgi:hypothetical protein
VPSAVQIATMYVYRARACSLKESFALAIPYALVTVSRESSRSESLGDTDTNGRGNDRGTGATNREGLLAPAH